MKNYTAETLELLAKILELSPKQKKIAQFFYLRKKLPLKAIYPKLETIASDKNVLCHVDTVCNFLRKHKDWVSITYRFDQTNIYHVHKDFFKAMSILDAAGVLNFNIKKQRRWMMNLFKKELQGENPATDLEVNGPNFTPPRPKFHPYSYSYTESFLRSSSTQSGVTAQRGLVLKTSELLKGIDAPEGAIRFIQHDIAMTIKALKANVTWYESQHEIKNREAFTISAYQHVKARDTFTRLRSQRREGRQIKPSYRY